MNVDVSKGFDLGCFHYQVKDDDEATEDLRSRSRYGECSWQRQIIRVSNEFAPEQYHNTFLHEAIEAVNEVYCNGKVKHDEITNIANGLAQIFMSLDIQFGGAKQ